MRDARDLLSAGIGAVVDVAANEMPAAIPRGLVYCRFPLIDGSGNPAWLLKLALETTARLLRDRISSLVYCSAGMSRSPGLAAAAISLLSDQPPDVCLAFVLQSGPGDVSPTLWGELKVALRHTTRNEKR